MSRYDHSTRSPKPFRIRLEPLPIDQRQAFVDRACALMSEGRLGPPRTSRLFIDGTCRSEIVWADVIGLMDHGRTSSCALGSGSGRSADTDIYHFGTQLDLCPDPARQLPRSAATAVLLGLGSRSMNGCDTVNRLNIACGPAP
jgi:hypothetical protein